MYKPFSGPSDLLKGRLSGSEQTRRVSAEATGAANADTASAAKLRRILSDLLNDLDMKKSPMCFEKYAGNTVR
jgi:hypothetical protein